MPDKQRPVIEYLLAAAAVAVTTLGAVAVRGRIATIDIAMVYLLAVVAIASRYRFGAALFAAAASVAALDFFFVPPYHTLNVHDGRYYLTFVVMLIVAIAMGRLTSHIRRQAEDAGVRERLASARAALQRELAGVSGRDRVLAIAATHLSRAAGAGAETEFILDDGAAGDGTGWPAAARLHGVEARLMATTAFRSGQPIGWGIDRYADADVLAVPIRTPSATLGAALLRPARSEDPLDGERLALVEALAADVGTALERADVAERHERARSELETERLRTALLSSLSHDLRSPLASIEGAASTLTEDGSSLPAPERQELSETILDESRRMHRMIGNLLDMVRVEAGLLAVHKEWQPLEEALGVALVRLGARLDRHRVDVRLPADLPLVPIDELLIEQVFINLLENVIKYTPPGTAVSIGATVRDGAIEVEVADDGPGVPPGEEEAVFRRFHRATSSDGEGGGSGLGLTICRGIVAAHGGRIWIEPGSPGTSVRFTLPLEGAPPAAVVEAPSARAE